MSFGFSVGDFLTAIELANRIRSRFVDAPDQFKATSNEVKNLSNVLQDTGDVLPQRDLSDQQKIELGEIIQGCEKVLKELEETLDKYQELDSNTMGFAGRSRRVWKRLRWDQKAIDGLRSRVTSNVLLFNTFLGQISNQSIFATKNMVDQLFSYQLDQNRQVILDWLTPMDYANQQSDFISRRQEGTGQWLLNSGKFRQWVDQNKQVLFCQGIPGAGKTMSAAIVIDKLFTEQGVKSNVGIAYVYCDFRRQHEQKPIDLLASLLKQLIQRRPSVPESMQQLYEKYQQKRTRPSIDEVSQTLQLIVRDYSRTFIVVDALDECQVADGGRKQFLTELFNLQAKTAVNLFVTSRFIPEIEREFNGQSIKLEIRANDEDLLKYLDGHIHKLPSFVSRNADLQKEIKTAIIKAADGMFLLGQLHFDSLVGKRSPKAVGSALEKLPKESEAYDRAYREVMVRIEGQVRDSVILAKQVLSWISCARRPLTTLELQYALAVEVGEPQLDNENLPEIGDMVSVCAGLVTIDEESNIIRLIHYTTQEFFERTKTNWFPQAEINIAEICITYLLFDIFGSGFCRSDKEFEARLQSNLFYDYAARNWGHHLRESDGHCSEAKFLESEIKVSASSQAMMVTTRDRWGNYSQKVPRQMKGIHLAAWFGLTEAVSMLLKRGYDSDSKNSDGWTPLSYAAANGYEAVVKLLVKRDDVDMNSKNQYGQTPLLYAAGYGHETVVKLLAKRNDVKADSKDRGSQTPLSHAAENGHEAVIKLLLERDDVKADSKNQYRQTPLLCAAKNGHEAVIELLIKRDDIDVNSKDRNGQTPLSYTAENGYEALAKLLMKRDDIVIHLKSQYGRTPLSYATEYGHEAVVKLLVERNDININSNNQYGQTPLSYAAENGHEAVVKLLVERNDIDINSKSQYGQTPLLYAISYGHEAVIKLLMERGDIGADSKDRDRLLLCAVQYGREAVVKLLVERDDVKADSKDQYGRTPLSYAAEYGHERVAKLLVRRDDVEADSKDQEGHTPLWWAAANRHETVVKLLIERDDVEADLKDQNGRTPLSTAARYGREAVVKLLIERDDVKADSKDWNGRTPLSYAAERGHESVVKLLVKRDDIDINSKDQDDRTPLLYAVKYGHEAVVKLLIKRNDTDINSKDKCGKSPLSYAAERGHEAMVKLLIERDDVDIDSKNWNGQTPLSYAAGDGREAVVKLLMERDDVDTDSKDQNGRTPLSYAARYGHEAVVKLLVKRDDVDTDSKDRNGQTPLSYAAENGYEAVVKLLVERDDVETDSKNRYGQTPLSNATKRGHEAVVKLLVERDDVESDSKDRDGQTPLSYAAERGHKAIVRLLLATIQVDINSKDDYGRTPLSLASKTKQWRGMVNPNFEAVVDLLLAHNHIDVNSRDPNGRTSLSWAAGEGHFERAELLLANNGIDRDIVDNDGHTALWWAEKNGHGDVVKILNDMT